MKAQIRFIVNPKSGTSRKKELHTLIEQHLDLDKYSYEYIETQYAGHARELAQEAVSSQMDIVVACGGDGTVNEIAGELINTNTKLAILPGGSGNGFAGHLGLSRKIIKSINILNQGQSTLIDSCKVNDQKFVNISGIGFDGLVSYRSKEGTRRGLWMYLSVSFKEMLRYDPPFIHVEINGQDYSGKYATVAVANASMYGYSFTLAPDASVMDGMFEIIMIKKTSLLNYLLNSYRFLNKTLHKSKHVITVRSNAITIKSDEAQFYHIDGEGFKSNTDLVFKILPKSLNVIHDAKVVL